MLSNGKSLVPITNTITLVRKHTLTAKWNIIFDKSKEWISFKPQLSLKVYPCYACKNMFSSKTTFQDHVNRRIVLITYKCQTCQSTLKFFNRCSFLLHARNHFTLAEGSINLAHLDVATLPLDLIGFDRNPTIPYIYDADNPATTIDDNQYINAQFYNPDEKFIGKQIITLKPFNLVFHYTTAEKTVLMVLRQLNPSIPLCEFVAQEYSKRPAPAAPAAAPALLPSLVPIEPAIKKEPLDEDDVPVPAISKIESLNNAANLKQYPSCPECMHIVQGSMALHFLGRNKPLDEQLTCDRCKYIAATKCSLAAHVRLHATGAPFVCPDCGKIFRSAYLLTHHMDDVCFHEAKQVRYRCPAAKCGKLFVSALTYAAHFANHFECLNRCNACNAGMFTDVDFLDHSKRHAACLPVKNYTCMVCKNVPVLGEDEYPEHLNWHVADRERFVYIYTCKDCRSYFRSTSTYGVHRQRCAKSERGAAPPNLVQSKCHFCGQRIAFREGERYKTCVECKQINHSPAEGGEGGGEEAESDKSKSSSERSDSESFESSGSSISRELIDEEKRLVRKRKGQLGAARGGKLGIFDGTVKLDDPVAFEGTYFCKVCDFTSKRREEFHKHIVAHRDVDTSYQCMECGECFVVKPSLVKHLLHFHKISDTDGYMRVNNCFDRTAIEALENEIRFGKAAGKQPVKENQCSVCYEQFEDGLTLSKHFRIHGMAFLKKATK